MKTLVKVDRNGSKHFVEDTCPRCGGSGKISYYGHVYNGVCFKCNGSGKYEYTIIERTPEYEATLAERRLAKAKAKAPKVNANFFKSMYLSENGDAYVVLGNTYEIKEQLKEAGAKFKYELGWYFDHEVNEFPTECVHRDDFMNKLANDTYTIDWDKLTELVEDIKERNKPVSTSEHVGVVGEKLYKKLTLKSIFTFVSHFSYYGELNAIYKFEDENGNVYIWKTSCKDLEEGEVYKLSGIVKEHSEYKGEKQTVLTRCKIWNKKEED